LGGGEGKRGDQFFWGDQREGGGRGIKGGKSKKGSPPEMASWVGSCGQRRERGKRDGG